MLNALARRTVRFTTPDAPAFCPELRVDEIDSALHPALMALRLGGSLVVAEGAAQLTLTLVECDAPSDSQPEPYRLRWRDDGAHTCTCEDWKRRSEAGRAYVCKHLSRHSGLEQTRPARPAREPAKPRSQQILERSRMRRLTRDVDFDNAGLAPFRSAR